MLLKRAKVVSGVLLLFVFHTETVLPSVRFAAFEQLKHSAKTVSRAAAMGKLLPSRRSRKCNSGA